MRALIIIFYFITVSSFAQANIFDEDYYAVIKDKTIKFEQKKDTIFITKCSGFEKCNTLKKSTYLLEEISSIDDKTKKIVLINPYSDVNQNTEEFRKKVMTIKEYRNERKAIDENYENHQNSKTQLAILYSKSELLKLKAISEITEFEAKEIFEEFITFIKSIEKTEFDYDDFSNWEKFNDLVIKRGYNPINALSEIGKRLR